MRITLFIGLFFLLATNVHAQVQIKHVSPPLTGPNIIAVHGDHLALVDPHALSNHKLLIMLVGTGAPASDNIAFDSFAASRGFHVLSLDYKNSVVSTVCSTSEDSACFDHFREEIIFGDPVSSLVDVDSANSIYHRLLQLLTYLGRADPSGGWKEYVSNEKIQWQKIVVAGHSQGAGHAAYFAKKYKLARAILFAGPQDYLVNFHGPAGWVRKNGLTSSSDIYAFLHRDDPYDFNKQIAGCEALLKTHVADTVSVLPGAVPASHHILIADVRSANPHGSMLQREFYGAWGYLLGR